MIRNLIPFKKQIGSKEGQVAEEPVLWAPVEDSSEMGITKTMPDFICNMPVKPDTLPGKGKIITVQSPEGGDGTTTIATNLAAVLAKKYPEQVVLVDLDGFGAVRGRMGFPTGQCLVSILDWLNIENASEINRAMIAHSSHIMVIPGVLHYDQLSYVTPSLIFNLLSILKERFKYIVLDCSPIGQRNNAWAAALVSDTILTIIKSARSSLDLLPDNLSYLTRLGCAGRVFILLNQSGLPGSIKTADLTKNEKFTMQIHKVLPYSHSVEELSNKRELIVLARPRDEFSKALRGLAADQEKQITNNTKNLSIDQGLIQELAAKYGIYHPIELEEEASRDTYCVAGIVAGLRTDDYRRVRIFVQNELRRQFKPEEIKGTRDKAVRSKLRSIVARALVSCDIPLGQSAVEELVEELGNDCLGFGPIEPYFHDPEVTEIRAEANMIRVEKHGRISIAEGLSFRDETHIRDVLDRMLAPTGRSINPNVPRVDATLYDGSRLKAHIPPVSPRGAMFSIRRFKQDMTIKKMIALGAMSQEIADFLKASVRSKQNILVSGGTSTGKTTILNCIASFIPPEESIITIEDPPELQLQHPDVRSLEARPPNNEGKGRITMRELMQDALRMAPKRIIVGECRGGEAFEMLQAMNTGHEGSLTTGHANSAYLMTKRLIALLQMADMGLPFEAIVEQITYLDLIIQVVRDKGGARRIDHICEITGVKRNEEGVLEVVLNTLWQYNSVSGVFGWVAREFTREGILVENGGWEGGVCSSGAGLISIKSANTAVWRQTV
ncbi:MAG: Flp pilus assembly complex ATPase component TadA [Peptococcaceae bacterium]|nr:Flp pilus assembly complex ATPase component TadA [Peptococcaceae bacterium]